jgi:catecholate siderophore receptor
LTPSPREAYEHRRQKIPQGTAGAKRVVAGGVIVMGCVEQSCVQLPRSGVGVPCANENAEAHAARKITVGCLIAVASVTGAKAQQPLAPVTVDAPVERKKPVANKPTPEQIRARNALRRAAREKQALQAQAAAAAAASATAQAPDRDPYADPNAPYKANRLSSSKFPEPIVNTPRSITVR